MTAFLLYLFETGICLSILFLIYVFFFRKETYFNFNRGYLIGIMILALFVPVIHVTLHVNNLQYIEEPVADIARIRSFYAEIISLSDPEFQASPFLTYEAAEFEDAYGTASNMQIMEAFTPNKTRETGKLSSINIAKLLLWIYVGGLIFFLIRLSLLTGWLFGLVRKNPKQKSKGYNLVLMKEEIPPFSFFSYIFINRNDTELKEFEQILTHEKVHVMQKHSLDLFLAHAFSVFQWFNPLVWQMQKAIKTTHEYIADRSVVSKGYELFDYQSLLLKQLVSIRSVELVNNFNLLFIKKRIAMMKKNNSGFPAKLKAVVVIPAALIVFFLFADMTVKSPVFSTTNFSVSKTSNFDGIWKNEDPKGMYPLIQFEGKELSILESLDNANVRKLNVSILKNKIVILAYNGPLKTESELNYEFVGEKLKIYWSTSHFSVYDKTNFKNSDEALRPDKFKNMNVPSSNVARVLDQAKYIIDVYITEDYYFIGQQHANIKNLKALLQKEIDKVSILDRSYLTFRIHADANLPMEYLHALKTRLRELKSFKIAYTVLSEDDRTELLAHTNAIAQKLPPLKGTPGMKFIEPGTKDWESLKDVIFYIYPDDNNSNKSKELKRFIKNKPDYIMCFELNNQTLYSDYISKIDMIYSVIYDLRDELSQSKYGFSYQQLSPGQQKIIRQAYPIKLTQNNTDEN